MATLIERVRQNLEERKENAAQGNLNNIPFPFPRFRSDIPGIEKGRYYIVTGATKSAKTQFATYTFLYYPLLFAFKNPSKLRVKIFYYTLEETQEDILERFMSFLLFQQTKGQMRYSRSDLSSANIDKRLPDGVLEKFDESPLSEILEFFQENVIFSNSTNPTGVWKQCKNFAEQNGTVYHREAKYVDEFGQTQVTTEAFDHFEPNDPNEYWIIFFDHVGLTTTEHGKSLRETIQKLSEYFVLLKNRYKFIPVAIQQQAMFEDNDAFKMNLLRPTIANLADNKATARDCDYCLSMFSPYKYGLKQSKDYDIGMLRDNFRLMECLVNRHGESNGCLPLFFDGAVDYFSELPSANDEVGMEKVRKRLEKIRGCPVQKTFFTNTPDKAWEIL